MRFMNLTPHPITIRCADGDMVIEPSGHVARVATVEEDAGNIVGVPTIRRTLGDVEGLPDPQDGTVYIVSSMVLSAVRGRDDVVAPDTGPTAVRDDDGRIVAVTRLVRP